MHGIHGIKMFQSSTHSTEMALEYVGSDKIIEECQWTILTFFSLMCDCHQCQMKLCN
jgi:hypothetical protein